VRGLRAEAGELRSARGHEEAAVVWAVQQAARGGTAQDHRAAAACNENATFLLKAGSQLLDRLAGKRLFGFRSNFQSGSFMDPISGAGSE
jgi:hypothetical protein